MDDRPAQADRSNLTPPAFDRIESWVFDLDNTLYPPSSGLFTQVNERIRAYLCAYLDIGAAEATALQRNYFTRYRSTLRGLMVDHGVAPTDFLDYVHDIDVSPIQPDTALRDAIASLPGRKMIFTNGSVRHAARILDRLDLTDIFEAVFDIHAADYRPKPDPQSYRQLLSSFDLNAKCSAFLEDMVINLEPAADLGMTTVWVRDPAAGDAGEPRPDYVHHEITDLSGWLARISR
jgi:putative hydrolase of the HAD superfamily